MGVSPHLTLNFRHFKLYPMDGLLKRLKKIVNLKQITRQRPDLAFITVPKTKLVMLLTHLRDIEQFTHLVFFTAVDRIEDGKFQLTYLLHNYEQHVDLGVLVEISRNTADMDSIHHLWEQAATFQRELKEMYGINFPGSPRVDENFILEGWHELPPMRREFDTKEYSEETYFPRPGRSTHDPQEYMKEKLYSD